jgi:hypothetical protein
MAAGFVDVPLLDGTGAPFDGKYYDPDDGSGLIPVHLIMFDFNSLVDGSNKLPVVDSAVAAALAGTIAVSGPLTNAQAVSLGLATQTTLASVLSAVSSPTLPTGASTAAKQPALGTAGTPSADVISVQGVVSGTAIPVSLAALPALAAGSNLIGKVEIVDISNAEYETVAASQTAQVLGAGAGATGDYLAGLLVIPATTSPGLVTILDNATSIPVFVGGASSVSNLIPFFVPLGIKSVSGAWKVTTGANVSVIAVGNFT